MVQNSTASQTGNRSRVSDIEAEVYEAVRSSGLLADLEDEDDLPEPDEEEEEEDDDDDENDEENEDDYGEVSVCSIKHLGNFTLYCAVSSHHCLVDLLCRPTVVLFIYSPLCRHYMFQSHIPSSGTSAELSQKFHFKNRPITKTMGMECLA